MKIPGQSDRLPVMTIFTEAIRLFSQNFFEILIAGTPWLILTLTLSQFPQVAQTIIRPVPESLVPIIMALMLLLYIILPLTAIINVHRIYLATQAKLRQRDSWGQSKRLLRLILWLILIAFFTTVLLIPLLAALATTLSLNRPTSTGLSPYILAFFATIGLIAAFVMTRFSLAIPAVAYDQEKISINWAWQLSRGNGWRLTLVVWALPAAVNFLPNLLPASDSILLTVGHPLLQTLATAISIGTLSLSYHWLGAQQKIGTVETQLQADHTAESGMATPNQA